MARIINTMLNKSGENSHPFLAPVLRGNVFNFSSLSMMLAVVFVIYALYYIKVCCLYTNFVESFIRFWSLLNFCQMLLLELWRWSFDFILCYTNLVCPLIDLHILDHTCIAEINPTGSWGMVFLMYCWIQFADILQRIFAYLFIKNKACNLLFLVVSLSGFHLWLMLISEN